MDKFAGLFERFAVSALMLLLMATILFGTASSPGPWSTI